MQKVDQYIPVNPTSIEAVRQYYKVRCAEMGCELISLIQNKDQTFIAKLLWKGNVRYSVYIPPNARRKGLIHKYKHLRMLTMPDCEVENAYFNLGIEYDIVTGWATYPEYKQIKTFYGNQKATRSGEFLMWHITRGCQLLTEMNASTEAIKAYMLHPMFQSDNDFVDNWEDLFNGSLSWRVARNLTEYRRAANAYLCRPYTDDWGLEAISQAAPIPFEDVRKMLVADKLQNQEDFLKFHAQTHPRALELDEYFQKWLLYLDTLAGTAV